MGWEFLPEVDYCCSSLSLKKGTIIIMLIELIFGGVSSFLVFRSHATILDIVSVVLAVTIMVLALLVLLKVCTGWPRTAAIAYVAVRLLLTVVILVVAIVTFFLSKQRLKKRVIKLVMWLVNVLISFYFVIVVNSWDHEEEDVED